MADLAILDALVEKWHAALGTWWRIPSKATRGAHRLICGDATDLASIRALCAGARPVLFATDPPFGVDYTGDNRPAGRRKNWGTVYRDVEDYPDFLRHVFTGALAVLDDRAAWYFWHAHTHASLIDSLWPELGILNHQLIVWVKPLATLGHSMWAWRHEPCFLGWKQGHKPPNDGDASLIGRNNSVWDVDWEDRNPLGDPTNDHPTRKPIELFARPMRKHTQMGDVCYEPFAGSGTQLIAAEQCGRLCYALEIEPRFVAAILERCHLVGLAPERVTAW